LDVGSPDKLKLVKPGDLRPAKIFEKLAKVALPFTKGHEYETPHSLPRKATRTINDPLSKYWRFSMQTDDFPGKSYGELGKGPNISLAIPSGLVRVESTHINFEFTIVDDQGRIDIATIPKDVTVGAVLLGVITGEGAMLDTEDGLVSAFLDDTAGQLKL